MANYDILLVAPPTAKDSLEPRADLSRIAKVTAMSWELNNIGAMTFVMPTLHYLTSKVDLLESEIEVYRNGRRLFTGVPVRARVGWEQTEFQCADLLWYFTKRVVGDPKRPNMIANANFEGGSAGGIPNSWNVGPDPIETPEVRKTNSAQIGKQVWTAQETRSRSVWTKYRGTTAADAETHTARVVARRSITRNGTGQVIDGVTIGANDRVLLTKQSNSDFNGIWIAGAGDWTRAAGYNTKAEINGSKVKVTAGTRYAGTGWKANISAATFKINENAISYAQYAFTKGEARDSYIYERFTPTKRGRHTFKGWFLIQQWLGKGTFKERGLYVRLFNTVSGKTIRTANFKISADTSRAEWQRAEASLVIPENKTGPLADLRIEFRLYVPHGKISWDATWGGTRDFLLRGETDKVAAFKSLVKHAQNEDYGKKTLRIGVKGNNVGWMTNKRYPHDEHMIIFDAMRELSVGSKGIDFYYDEDIRRVRILGKRGRVRDDLRLETGKNIESINVYEDGEQTVNSIIALAPGEGPDREEVGRKSTRLFSGMVYEGVFPYRSHLRILDEFAESMLARRNRIVTIAEVTTMERADDLIDRLRVGDILPVAARRGRMQVDAQWRLYGMDLDTTKDVLTLRFNPS